MVAGGLLIGPADRLVLGKHGSYLDSASDWFDPAGLYRRACRKELARGAYNLAISHFNRGDLAGDRFWLRRAAKAGDRAAALQARRFETRLPEAVTRKIGRLRPEAKLDAFNKEGSGFNPLPFAGEG